MADGEAFLMGIGKGPSCLVAKDNRSGPDHLSFLIGFNQDLEVTDGAAERLYIPAGETVDVFIGCRFGERLLSGAKAKDVVPGIGKVNGTGASCLGITDDSGRKIIVAVYCGQWFEYFCPFY